jgi:hypothetical protein
MYVMRFEADELGRLSSSEQGTTGTFMSRKPCRLHESSHESIHINLGFSRLSFDLLAWRDPQLIYEASLT